MNHKWGACSISYLTAQAGSALGFPRALRSRHAFIYPFTSGLHGGTVLIEWKLNEHLMVSPFQWPIHSPTRPLPHSWFFKCISWALSGWGAHVCHGHIWRSLRSQICTPTQGRAASHLTCECVSPIRSLAEGEELHSWLSIIFSFFMTLSGRIQRTAGGNWDAS